jgi:D-gamma-glutamyl-meso-diaminopimelic acid endopeptidase CwlS
MFDKILICEFCSSRFSDREIALSYAQKFEGTWYTWGGDDPAGFDCSGLVCEFLQASGKLDRKADMTAAQLYQLYTPVSKPYRGCLVFYENDKKEISHVEIMLNERLSLGAMGGGANIKTLEAAIAANAFIKIRNIYSRQGIAGYSDPFMTREATGN